MRRLLRWAFNFAALVSAVLFVATCVLWVRSHRGGDSVSRNPGPLLCLTSYSGRMILMREGDLEARPRPAVWSVGRAVYVGGEPGEDGFTGFNFVGFRLLALVQSGSRQRFVIVPDWAIVLALALLPGAWVVEVAGRLRRPAASRWRPVRGVRVRPARVARALPRVRPEGRPRRGAARPGGPARAGGHRLTYGTRRRLNRVGGPSTRRPAERLAALGGGTRPRGGTDAAPRRLLGLRVAPDPVAPPRRARRRPPDRHEGHGEAHVLELLECDRVRPLPAQSSAKVRSASVTGCRTGLWRSAVRHKICHPSTAAAGCCRSRNASVGRRRRSRPSDQT